MSATQTNCDFKTIIVKNLPKTITNPDEYFRKNYGAIATRSYGRQRILLRYDNENIARTVLHQLHQYVINGNIISAEFLGNRKLMNQQQKKSEKIDNDDNIEKIPDYVNKLFAISSAHGFDQPPPSYLKYSYPKINRDILDSISIALMSNTKFYTQVLHLMNRMNLEPPFLPNKSKFIPPAPSELKNAQTQTDNIEHKGLLGSDESEIESDNNDNDKINKINYNKKNPIKKKRKFLEESEQVQKKARKLLNSKIHTKNLPSVSRQEENLENIFEKQDKKISMENRILMNVSKLKLPEKSENIEKLEENIQEIEEISERNIKLKIEDLKLNRIPQNQLKELPVYRNYIQGERTNKLYIKNLNKDVTELDLQNIYSLFTIEQLSQLDSNSESGLDIKLMQHGRMKGQAFITFLNINDNKMELIESALNETNGYILKNKPMIVSFGKK